MVEPVYTTDAAARQALRHALSAALGSTTGPRARAALRLVHRTARAVVEMGEDDARRMCGMVMGWVRTEGETNALWTSQKPAHDAERSN